MLKGRATIQLRNAKTGEIEQEVYHENLVTNAPKNIYSLPYAFRVASSNNNNVASWDAAVTHSATNLFESFFGGILLFNKKNTESPDNMLPSSDNDIIGAAGSGAENSNARCGERNTSESQAIDNGYRFVWDFDTDKANGTINSISLTSQMISKLVSTSTADGISLQPNLSSTKTYSEDYICYQQMTGKDAISLTGEASTITTAYIVKIYNSEDDRTFDVLWLFGDNGANTKNYKNKFFLAKTKYLLPNVKSVSRGGSWTHALSTTIITDGFGNAQAGGYNLPKFHVDIDVAKDGTINVVQFDPRTHNTTHYVFSDSGEKTNEISVTMPTVEGVTWTSYSVDGKVCVLYFDDYYHFFVTNENGQFVYIKSNVDGVVAFTNTKKTAISYPLTLYKAFRDVDTGYLFLLRETNSYNYVDIYTDSGWLTNKQVYQVFCSVRCENNFFGKKPFAIRYNMSDSGSIGNALYIWLPVYFLSTINNLDTPVTKTESQTMKIIYEIVEEEQ